MRGRQGIVAAITALGMLAGVASAEDQLLPGRKLVLKSTAAGGKAVFATKAPLTVFPASGSLVDPSMAGGTFRLVNPTTGESQLFDLPPAGWSLRKNGTIYKFSNAGVPAGSTPAKVALLKQKKGMRVVAKASGLTLDEAQQGSVGVIVTTGGNRYCALFGGTVKRDEPGRFIAKNAPAPTECPTDSACGNGQLDFDEECEAGIPCAAGQECFNCRCVGTGDVGLVLTWNNGNDVDIHVEDPNHEEIFYGHSTSASGGALDQDANGDCVSTTTTPVENVFWPPAGAPAGTYTVRIVLYRNCPGVPLETPYTLQTVVDGVATEFSGVLTSEARCRMDCATCGNCTTVTSFIRD
jgi:hypothetical protein